MPLCLSFSLFCLSFSLSLSHLAFLPLFFFLSHSLYCSLSLSRSPFLSFLPPRLSLCLNLTVWYYFGVVGSFVFILIQLILLVDFAHTWNQNWVENAENGNSKCWYAGIGKSAPLHFPSIDLAVAKKAYLCLVHKQIQ